jgi:hypothetical protein
MKTIVHCKVHITMLFVVYTTSSKTTLHID